MRYYKQVSEGYILAVGTGNGGTEIQETEYNNILEMIRNSPAAPEGHEYRLKTDLTWELYELPSENADPELTTEETLNIILGGGANA